MACTGPSHQPFTPSLVPHCPDYARQDMGVHLLGVQSCSPEASFSIQNMAVTWGQLVAQMWSSRWGQKGLCEDRTHHGIGKLLGMAKPPRFSSRNGWSSPLGSLPAVWKPQLLQRRLGYGASYFRFFLEAVPGVLVEGVR